MDLLWTDFLNSVWRDWRGTGKPPEDRLGQRDWQTRFLNKWELQAPVPAGPDELKALVRLRTFLHQLTEKLVAGEQIDQADVDGLNAFLKQTPVIRTIVKGENGKGWRLKTVAAQQGWAQVMDAVVTSFIQTAIEGNPERIKICENKDCLWVFYDNTRNRSKRYCDDKTCGNLIKVRKFRERQKTE